MNFLKLFTCSLLGVTATAFGNAKVIGNGGKIVVCTETQRAEHMQLVDLYEAQLLRDWVPQVPSGAKDPVSLAGLVAERLKAVNPTRYERYKGFLETFMSEARFVSGQQLVEIPDSNHPAYPKDCKVQQVVTQRSPITTEQPRYLINNDLWSEMDQTNQAALILHEVIYREQILVDVETSEATRFINSALWSNRIAGMDQVQYFDFMKDFIPDVDFEDFNFAICRPGYVDGALNQCERREGPTFKKETNEWLVRGFILPSWSPLAQGKIQYFNLVDPKTNATTRFMAYGPYSKHESDLVISHGADWLAHLGISQMSYQGHEIEFITNLLPTPYDTSDNRPWSLRKKECRDTWECQAPSLDLKAPDLAQEPLRFWSSLTTTRDHRLLNFEVDYMKTSVGSQMTNCRGLVNLHADGSINRCRGDGVYQDKNVNLVFDKSFVGWDRQGRIEFALEVANSKAYFQNKWISVIHADWQEIGQYYFHGFTTNESLQVEIDHQIVDMPAASYDLNQKGEIVRFQISTEGKSAKMKYGHEEILVRSWYLAGNDLFYEPAPVGSRMIRLAESKKLKNSKGIVSTYHPGWNVYIDNNGVVLDCRTSGGVCF